MTDTAKNSAAAEEGVYETPEDIAAEAAKPPSAPPAPTQIAPSHLWTPSSPARWGGSSPGRKPARATCSRPTRRWKCF